MPGLLPRLFAGPYDPGVTSVFKFLDEWIYDALTGTLSNANAKVIGWAGINVNVGEPLTLWVNINFGYGTATTVVPDTVYYLSGTVLGGLDTVASVGGTKPIAVGLPNGRLHVIRFLG